MNQIKDYIEVMFKELPKNKEIENIKVQITQSMLDKYEAYLEQGNTDAQSIGMVIGEFGSIEDIKVEFGINVEENYYDFTRLKEFLHFTKTFGFMIGLGVLINCMGIGITAWISEYNIDVLTTLSFFGIGIVGVSIYIIYGIKYSNYKDMRCGKYELSSEEYAWMSEHKEALQKKFVIQLVLGIIICILGFVLVNIPGLSSNFEGFVFFLFVGVGVFLIINGSVPYTIHSNILNGTYQIESEEKVTWFSALVPVACIVYVILGLIYGGQMWYIGALMIPIAAIITGVGNSIVNQKNHK